MPHISEADFDVEAYVNARGNPDLLELYNAGNYKADGTGFDAYEHWILHGEDEGRNLNWDVQPGAEEKVLAKPEYDDGTIDPDEWARVMLAKGAGAPLDEEDTSIVNPDTGSWYDEDQQQLYVDRLRSATDSGSLGQQAELDVLNRINAEGIDWQTNPYGQQMGLEGTQMASHYVAQQGQDRGYFKPQEPYSTGNFGQPRPEAAAWDTTALVPRSSGSSEGVGGSAEELDLAAAAAAATAAGEDWQNTYGAGNVTTPLTTDTEPGGSGALLPTSSGTFDPNWVPTTGTNVPASLPTEMVRNSFGVLVPKSDLAWSTSDIKVGL